MEGILSLPGSNLYKENDCEKKQEGKEMAGEIIERDDRIDEIEDTADKVQCMTLHKREKNRKGEKLSWGKSHLWRHEQKNTAAKLEKRLKAKWEFDELIEEQLKRFNAHYNLATVPTRLKDVSQLLMPKWEPPLELAAQAWLGDWRPSAILDLVHHLAHCSSSSMSSSLSESNNAERLLSQLIHEIRVEETIIDEEMSEIQATCILHLPFAPINNGRSGTAALSLVHNELKKIGRVIVKAQQLRFKALSLVVNKVLNPIEAAEFLVAFAGIQDVIHQFAAKHKSPECLLALPGKSIGTDAHLRTLRALGLMPN